MQVSASHQSCTRALLIDEEAKIQSFLDSLGGYDLTFLGRIVVCGDTNLNMKSKFSSKNSIFDACDTLK